MYWVFFYFFFFNKKFYKLIKNIIIYIYFITTTTKNKGVNWGMSYSKIGQYSCAPCNNFYKTYLRLIGLFFLINF